MDDHSGTKIVMYVFRELRVGISRVPLTTLILREYRK